MKRLLLGGATLVMALNTPASAQSSIAAVVNCNNAGIYSRLNQHAQNGNTAGYRYELEQAITRGECSLSPKSVASYTAAPSKSYAKKATAKRIVKKKKTYNARKAAKRRAARRNNAYANYRRKSYVSASQRRTQLFNPVR